MTAAHRGRRTTAPGRGLAGRRRRPRRTGPAVPARTGPRTVLGPGRRSGPGRCWSWLPRRPLRSGPAGSASRSGPGSDWSPRCPGSGPPCTWTPPSPCRSVWRPTRPTRCAPGWPASRRQPADPPVRQVVRDLLLRARHGRAGRLPPAGPGRTAQAPWPVTTIVSCLPVLVLAMGTALAHMLRAEPPQRPQAPDRRPGPAISGPGPVPADQPPASGRTSANQAAGPPGTRSRPRADTDGPPGTGRSPRSPDQTDARPASWPASLPRRGARVTAGATQRWSQAARTRP